MTSFSRSSDRSADRSDTRMARGRALVVSEQGPFASDTRMERGRALVVSEPMEGGRREPILVVDVIDGGS